MHCGRDEVVVSRERQVHFSTAVGTKMKISHHKPSFCLAGTCVKLLILSGIKCGFKIATVLPQVTIPFFRLCHHLVLKFCFLSHNKRAGLVLLKVFSRDGFDNFMSLLTTCSVLRKKHIFKHYTT